MRALIVTIALVGCGEWVQYDEEPTVAVRTPGAEDLDQDTRARFEAIETLDHLILEGLLAQAVRSGEAGYTLVDYAALGERPESLARLDEYLAMLDVVQPAQLRSDAERVAFWFNAYNAAVLRGVLDQWGGDREWSVSQGGFAFFDQQIWTFGGTVLSLNHVEHGIIRGDFGHTSMRNADEATMDQIRAEHALLWGGADADPRLHMALNCASLGCPNLPATAPYAFRAETLDAQLEALVVAFLENPGKGAGPDGITSLFLWYRSDFTNNDYTGAEDFIARHRPGGLEGVDAGSYLVYDWSLNVTP